MNLCHLGAGAFGAVHKAVWRDCDVAVKLLSNTQNITKVCQKKERIVISIHIHNVFVHISKSRK
jgi:hypothetical protein